MDLDAGVTIFGAFPVAMIVRDHQIVAAFSTASVGFVVLFTVVIIVFAFLPAQGAAGDTLLPSCLQAGMTPCMRALIPAWLLVPSIYSSKLCLPPPPLN